MKNQLMLVQSLLLKIKIDFLYHIKEHRLLFVIVRFKNMSGEHLMELAVHPARELSFSREADPYDPSVLLVAISYYIALLDQTIDRYRECSRRDTEGCRGLAHRPCIIRSDRVECVHFSYRKVREISLLDGLLLSKEYVLEYPDETIRQFKLIITHAEMLLFQNLRKNILHHSDQSFNSRQLRVLTAIELSPCNYCVRGEFIRITFVLADSLKEHVGS